MVSSADLAEEDRLVALEEALWPNEATQISRGSAIGHYSASMLPPASEGAVSRAADPLSPLRQDELFLCTPQLRGHMLGLRQPPGRTPGHVEARARDP
jgi:hypothetical protein